MSVTGAQIVKVALSYKGREENPMGSNTGRFVEACQRDTFLGGTGWPWCAAFVCRVAKDAGVPLDYPSAGAHDLANHYSAQRVSFADAKPGDVVDYNIGSGHTGILVAKSQSAITSIDGNWADAVTEHSEPLSVVRGFWRLPGVTHTAVPTPVVPAKPRPRLPRFVIATSASGHRKVLFRAKTKKGVFKWLADHKLSLFPNGVTISRRRKH